MQLIPHPSGEEGIEPSIPRELEAPIFSVDGKVDKNLLYKLVIKHGESLGIDQELSRGIYNYIFHNGLLKNQNDFRSLLRFMKQLKDLIGSSHLAKARSFNYISEAKATPTFEQACDNASFMVDKLEAPFFEGDIDSRKKRGNYMSSVIPGTKCFLVCTGGMGEGTFAVDFAISANPCLPLLGQLWHTGFDTERSDDGSLVGRIIGTGSKIGRGDDNKEKKLAINAELFKTLRISAQRALTFLILYLCYDIGVTKMKALTTEGATTLSSLGNATKKFDYSGHFRKIGFPTEAGNWLEIPDFKETFYDVLTSSPRKRTGLFADETDGLDAIFEAFSNLKDAAGRRFPFSVCGSQSHLEIERVMAAFRRMNNR